MDIAITDIWKVIKRRFWLIIILIAISLTLTGVLSFYLLEPKYEATVKLLVQSQNDSNQMAYTDLETNQRLMTTYSEIIKSNRIAGDVINRLNLNITVKDLLKSVKVHATEESLITSVTVTNPDPEMAVTLANGLAQSFYDNLESIMKVDNVSILDEAELPANPIPVSPKPYLNMSVAFILTCVIGVCVALLLEFMDRTVKTEEHVEEILGVPVLAVNTRYKRKRYSKHKKHAQAKRKGANAIEKESSATAILP